MKRTFDESLGLVSKKARPAGDPEIRILIPSKGAGAIIGKGGENVKKLRADLNAEIAIPDSSSPERVVHISTPNDNHGEIVAEILQKIEEVVPRKGTESEVRILIHQSQAGAVIGRAGFKIKELRETTGTNITVLSECCPRSTDRVIICEGELLKIVEAVKEIMKICNEVPIKGMVVNYDACSYEPAFADVYGGYPPDRKSMARGRGGDGLGGPPGLGRPGLGAMGRGMGIGGMGMMRGMGRGAVRGFGGGGGGGGGGGFGGYGPSGPAGYMDPAAMGFDDDGEVTMSQFTVPSDLAGTIIGKGGDRINRIREESGARIVVNAPEGESSERVITIQGTPGRIQMAKYLLQQCVKASPAGRRYIQLANM